MSLPRQAAGTLRLQPPRGAAGVLPIEERPAERALVSERAVRIERPGSTSSIGFRVPLPVRRLRIGVAWEALAEVEIDAPQEPRVIELRTGVPPKRRGVKIRPVGASMSLVGTARVVPDGSPARRSS